MLLLDHQKHQDNIESHQSESNQAENHNNISFRESSYLSLPFCTTTINSTIFACSRFYHTLLQKLSNNVNSAGKCKAKEKCSSL